MQTLGPTRGSLRHDQCGSGRLQQRKKGAGAPSGVGVPSAPGALHSLGAAAQRYPGCVDADVVVGEQSKVVVACPCGVGCTGAGCLVSPHLAEVLGLDRLPLDSLSTHGGRRWQSVALGLRLFKTPLFLVRSV